MNNQLQSNIILHDNLHSFRQRRGVGTEIMEANMEQKLAGIVHKPLLQVFIDMQKAYDFSYRGRCM